MTQPDPNIQRLAHLREYRQFIESLFTDAADADGNHLILVLIAFEMTLKRRIDKRLPTVDWAHCMRWAVKTSNKLLDQIYDEEFQHLCVWNPATDKPVNRQQALAGMLMRLVHELNGDIAEAEEYLANQLTMAAEEFVRETFAAYEAGNLKLEAGRLE
jgi:hypothetical protein